MHRTLAAPAVALATLCAASLPAQWPTTPTPNLPIGDANGEQTLAKIAATSDGGCYVGWFDQRSGSYAVHLQRFDAAGAEQWPHGGVLVSGNPQSTSLVDWDLLCDRDDHCVLAFTDTRAGGDLDVYAYRVAPGGAQVWGTNGIALSNNADYEPNPRVCQAGDGDFVFVWANTVQRTLQLQRVDATGVVRFAGDGITIPGETGATPGFARVVAGAPSSGDAIVSWVRTTAFSGNKHVHAQKFDALGNALWNGGTRVAVFDQGSVPIAHEPRLLPDGQGGAVCAWHFASGNVFAVRAQWLTAGGSEAWPHNGVDASTSANSKFDPAIVWRAGANELFVAWNERNVAQTTWGLLAQKLDAAGARAWGATGVVLLPIDTTVKFAPVAAAHGDSGFATAVLVESLGPQQKSVQAFALDGGGALRFGPVLASTVASDKLRVALATTRAGTSMLAWTDQRSGADVYGAALDLAGGLGVALAAVTPYACNSPAGSLTAAPRPAFGTTVTLAVGNPLATQPTGSTGGFFLFGFAPPAAFPCGIALPGFGMAGAAQPGEYLLDPAAAPVAVFGGIWASMSTPVTMPLPIPFDPALGGVDVFVQGLMVDFSPAAAVPFGLASAVRLRVGS